MEVGSTEARSNGDGWRVVFQCSLVDHGIPPGGQAEKLRGYCAPSTWSNSMNGRQVFIGTSQIQELAAIEACLMRILGGSVLG